MNIFVVNKSSVLEDAQVQNWLPAFNVYVDHVCEWWPRSVALVWCPRDKEPELAWKLVFADTSDEAGDLGYHDFTPDGRLFFPGDNDTPLGINRHLRVIGEGSLGNVQFLFGREGRSAVVRVGEEHRRSLIDTLGVPDHIEPPESIRSD